jgi:RNase P subunit RPR2
MDDAPRRYQRRSCTHCHSTGEHQLVRVLSADCKQYRPGWQCAVCGTVQLTPLPSAAQSEPEATDTEVAR